MRIAFIAKSQFEIWRLGKTPYTGNETTVERISLVIIYTKQ